LFVPGHYQAYQPTGSTANEISASVEDGVRSGALASGALLPPVRALAATLGVSPATVASAYQVLRQRGLIETAGRNGTRVRPRPPVVGQRAARVLPVPADALDLSSGEPDERLLPDLDTAFAHLAADASQLREMAAVAFERDGIDLSAAAIGVAGGALDAIERLLGAHLRAGDRVAVEDPGWANLLDLIAAMGLHAVPMSVDEDGPLPSAMSAALSAGARAVVVTTRAQNPTGGAVTAARAAELRTLLAAHPSVLVIEDDHAGDLSAVPLASLGGATDNWAFVRSVSKPYGPALRCAPFAADAATLARFEGRQRLGTGFVSPLLQRAVAGLWTSPSISAQVREAGRSYDERRDGLVAALRVRGLEAAGRTGINVWVRVPDETAAITALREAGYAVAPGALYRLASPPAVRVTVSRLDLGGLDQFADVMAKAVETSPGRRPSW
jgi:DNA-binding transcriptional MocR family regulator